MLEFEHVGDGIVHDIVRRLNKTFVTPLERDDICDLASTLDEILDSIEATADLMVLYRLAGPTTHAVEQAVVLAKQTAALKAALDGLEKRKRLDCHWVAVNRLENDGDMKRIDIIKRKDIYATLEAAMDQCEDVANILGSIVLTDN